MKKASNKPKKSSMEKYFAQKELPVRDIVFGVLTAVGVIVWYWWYYYAIYGAIVGAIGLIASRSVRIKDSEVDELIAKLEKDNGIVTSEKKTSRVYDMRVAPIIKGKASKLRTSRYVLCELDMTEVHTRISVWTFDLLAGTVAKQEYTVTDEPLELITEDIMTPVGRKRASYLAGACFEENIPVDIGNVNVSNIVEKLCK